MLMQQASIAVQYIDYISQHQQLYCPIFSGKMLNANCGHFFCVFQKNSAKQNLERHSEPVLLGAEGAAYIWIERLVFSKISIYPHFVSIGWS
jgi:hypothetical protein